MENNDTNKLYAKSINIPVTSSYNSLTVEHIPNYNTFSYSEDNSIHGSTYENNDIFKENIQLKNNQFDSSCSLVFKKNDLNSSHEINKRNKTSALSSALRASNHLNKSNNTNNKISYDIKQNERKYNTGNTDNDNKELFSNNLSDLPNLNKEKYNDSKNDTNDTKSKIITEDKNTVGTDSSVIAEKPQKEGININDFSLNSTTTTKNSNESSLIPYNKDNKLNILRFANSDSILLPNQQEFLLSKNIEYLSVNTVQNDKNICQTCKNKLKNQLTKPHHVHHHDNYISLDSQVKISNINSIDIIGAGNDRNSITTNTLNRMLNSPSYSQVSIDRQQLSIDKLNNKEKTKAIVSYYADEKISNKIDPSSHTLEELTHTSDDTKENYIKTEKKEKRRDKINTKHDFMEYPLIEKKIYSLSLNDSDILKGNPTPLTSLTPLNNTSNLFENKIKLFHPKQSFKNTEKNNVVSNELSNSPIENCKNIMKKSSSNDITRNGKKNDSIDKEDILSLKADNNYNQDSKLFNKSFNKDNNTNTNNDDGNENDQSYVDELLNNNIESSREVKDNDIIPVLSPTKKEQKEPIPYLKKDSSYSNADIMHMDNNISLISLEVENEDKDQLPRLGNESKGSFEDEDDIRACSFENEEDLIDNIFDKASPTSLPLLPYGHQVGGHAPFLRFSDKALCKLMNPAERAFYESVNNIYPQLRPFIPGYYGVINVYFNNNNGSDGNSNTWVDNIPVAIIENENYSRNNSQTITFESAGDKSSQLLNPSSCNNYLNHDHSSCSECGKPNISPLSHNSTKVSVDNQTDSNNKDKSSSGGIAINTNNKKVPIEYISSYTDGESRMGNYNYYQKLREKVLRDALTIQNRRYRYSQLRASSLTRLKRRHSLNALSNEYQGFTPLIEDKPDVKNTDASMIGQNINPWSLHCLNNQINKMGQSDKENQKPEQFILIEDLTYGMKYPCILDLKMGTRQHGVDATPQKRKSQEKKCESTTSKLFGVRMCGMQVYKTNTKTFEYSDKYKGRKIVASHFKEGLLSFLDNGEKLLVGFIPKIVEKLKTLYSVVEQLTTSRFYASSLMLFYDGAWADEENESNSNHNLLLIHNSDNYLDRHNTNNEDDPDSYSTVQRCLYNKEVVVHLIDFAHCTNDAHLMVSTDPKKRGDIDITQPVINSITGKEENYILVPFPPTHKGPDMGYLLGLRNLIMFFEEIYKDFGANGHVYKKDYPEIFNKQNINSEFKE
ncbi:SAICAR synthase-like protein [Piromyces finnis]|uniref:Kinase n=1 Tax=Piromyces finnis TaxID=1754191 RepID=A0A1Y1VBZ7_9FUNG|nr:SAICAR synthase-like protein [Piromyces finnis]|eukprot:ORX52503.1 SAICAR synthase-like protein [Piromyces finnis]